MLGETNHGFCFRERKLWYGTGRERSACKLPLTDGKVCGDKTVNGSRCPYNKESGNQVARENLVFITYPQCNKK